MGIEQGNDACSIPKEYKDANVEGLPFNAISPNKHGDQQRGIDHHGHAGREGAMTVIKGSQEAIQHGGGDNQYGCEIYFKIFGQEGPIEIVLTMFINGNENSNIRDEPNNIRDAILEGSAGEEYVIKFPGHIEAGDHDGHSVALILQSPANHKDVHSHPYQVTNRSKKGARFFADFHESIIASKG